MSSFSESHPLPAVSFSARCAELARHDPERPAIVLARGDGETVELTRMELARRAAGIAALLARRGVGANTLVIIAMPTVIEHFPLALAAWQLGACVLPLNPELPVPERRSILELAASWRPCIIAGDWEQEDIETVSGAELAGAAPQSGLGDRHVTPLPGKAIGSGGSTGRPKLIVDPKPWVHIPGRWGALNRAGLRPEQTTLVVGKLYHNMGFSLSHVALFEGHTVVVPEKFDAALAVDLIERYRVQFMAPLPIMMQRIAKLEGIESRDFSSIEGMYHSGGSCPPWVKQAWLKLVPPERQWELYGSSEEKGCTVIRGDEWLARPGSVGRPFESDIRILDSDGEEAAQGSVGEIHMRNRVDPEAPVGSTWPQEPTCEYIGAEPPREIEGGYVSVGDMGWLDADGFLYLADRRVDMIKSGGINIFAAEIEGVLSEHEDVADVAVIGLPDAEWGHRVHAIVEPRDFASRPTRQQLDEFCRARLAAYKAPKTFEFLERLPRDPSGKIRRAALREDRRHSTEAGAVTAGSPAV